MKVLELFAGTRSIGKAFEELGHEVYSIEWNKEHQNINWYTDIGKVTANDILKRFGKPDVIWASPDCTSYSIAGIRHHRRKIGNDLVPISEYAKFCDDVNIHVLDLIKELNPKYYFIENPRGGLRKMKFMQDLERYTVTYCQYDWKYMKPTDIWTNHQGTNFKPMCKNGDSCHISNPRGANKGIENLTKIERSLMPIEFCRHIAKISEL